MSLNASRSCDGCGQVGGVDVLPEVPALDYCSECMPQTREFLKAVDDLHTRMTRQWNTELQDIRDRFANIKELPY